MIEIYLLVPSNLFTACAAFKYHRKRATNTIKRTNVGINVQGKAMAFNTSIPIIDKYICTVSKILRGRNSSIAPISFENRLRMRPEKITYT